MGVGFKRGFNGVLSAVKIFIGGDYYRSHFHGNGPILTF